MLVVDQVVPEGPGDGKIQPGDILVAVNGHPCTMFIPLEEVLDTGVGKTVTLKIERGGDVQEYTLTIQVEQLKVLSLFLPFTICPPPLAYERAMLVIPYLPFLSSE